MNKGMDRDIALDLLADLNDIAAKLVIINDNEFVPHITVQPVSQTAQIGDYVDFSVVANNVSSYQWQTLTIGATTWVNVTQISGYNTDTLHILVSAPRYNVKWRCKITGKDNSVIYTNEVQITEPEPEPEPEG